MFHVKQLNPKSRKGTDTMKMYFFNINTSTGWEHKYPYHECDADAMQDARRELQSRDDANMIAVYRHEDHDTCGIKHFVVAYDK